MPDQEIERSSDHNGGWRLVLKPLVPAEDWNAQISLLTGRAAAQIMLAGKIGLLRTMPGPAIEAVARLRIAAKGLDVNWPDGMTVGQVLAGVDPSEPKAAAFVDEAAELMRGAGYTAFAGSAPADPLHSAVAAPYAHVTAPLRRLADRYVTEVCLALHEGREVPAWAAEALPKLPEVMSSTDRIANAAERGAVDLVEATMLANRVGETFPAVVLESDQKRPLATIAVIDPVVRARCDGRLVAGSRITARLTMADVNKRQVRFEAVQPAAMPTFSSYDGTVLSYRLEGSGPLLICVPGGPARDSRYLGDLGGMSAYRTLVILDNRGSGESRDTADPSDVESYRADRLVEDVEALRKHLGPETFALLGHSAGARCMQPSIRTD